MSTHAMAIRYTEDDLTTFNRAIGMLRRRQITVHTITAAPWQLHEGDARMTVLFEAEPAEAERLGAVFRSVVGIHEASVYLVQDVVARELALITIATADGERGALLDTLQLYGAVIVEEATDAVVAEISGSAAWVLSCLRALERFRITEVARSGAVAVQRVLHTTNGSPA